MIQDIIWNFQHSIWHVCILRAEFIVSCMQVISIQTDLIMSCKQEVILRVRFIMSCCLSAERLAYNLICQDISCFFLCVCQTLDIKLYFSI